MPIDSKFEALVKIIPNVSRETFDRFVAFEALFRKWSKAFNLAAPSTLDSLWERHILDSAQVYNIHRPKGKWLDIGSGGGLPGIIMAIFMAEVPNGCVHLVESNGKKAAFLRAALAETGASGVVHNVRIEDAPVEIAKADMVTARALAPMPQLLRLAAPWMTSGTPALFHKGREYRTELKLARDEWRFDLVEHISAIETESVILEIRLLSKLDSTRL